MKKPAHFLGERGGLFYCTCVILSCCSITLCFAQKEFPPGAKSNGMAGAVSGLADGDHSLQAVAALAYVKRSQYSSYYKNHHFLPELHTVGAYLVVPVKKVAVSALLQRFGPEHYKEVRAGIGVAHQIAHTALGLRIYWEQLAVEAFRTQHAMTGELGGMVQLTPKLTFGASLYNFTLSSFEHQLLPVILRCGLSAKLLPELTVSGEAEKNIHEPLVMKWGAQYTMNPSVQLLAGFRHPANSLHAGLFVTHRKLSVGYSLSWIIRFGVSQEFSLVYHLSSRQAEKNYERL